MRTPLRYPRPPSLSQLGPDHNVVESSAGTGKTFLLEHLFVDLLLTHGVPAEQILVVTFTDKAATELVLRLRRLLGEMAALAPDHPKAIAARDAPEAEAWLLDERARQVVGQALLAFDRIAISTIHAFCQRVLREHAFAQGRLFDEEAIGAEASFATAFADVLRTRVATDAKLAALVEAWLGSGNSIAELGELLHECEKAKARALRPELDEAGLAAALAAWPPLAEDDAGLEALLVQAKISRRDTRRHCRASLAHLSRQVAEHAGNLPRFLAAVSGSGGDLGYLLDKLEGKHLAPELAAIAERLRELRATTVPFAAVVARALWPIVRERATRLKRAAGRFDFEDMLVLVEQALADPGPAGRALARSLRARYQHALIDEFQDTDEIQWSIFRRIFVEAGDHHGLTVIGDPKQAIYGFRGANVETYLEASRALLARRARRLVLHRNFRATAELVAATNAIFDQDAGFFRPESGIVYGTPVTCGQAQRRLSTAGQAPASPVVLFGLATRRKSLKADHARGAVAAAIVHELGDLLGDACPLRLRDGERARPVRARDVFVLTFTSQDSWAMGRALGQARIPYAFYKQDQLFATSEAAEILDVLRALAEPEDAGLRARALLTRFFAVDLPEIAAARESSSAPARLFLRLAAAARTDEAPALFAALLEETGVLRRELYAGAGERGLTNFLHILELLTAEWAQTHASLPELADRLSAFVRGTETPPGRDGDLQRLETDADAVQILTVHKAKGLEADVVFVYGGTGQMSSRHVSVVHEAGQRLAYVGRPEAAVRSACEAEQHDERCRVLYVALTRARYRLYLPHYPAQFTHLNGPYTPLNRRLDAILAGPSSGLFERRPVDCEAPSPMAGATPLPSDAPALDAELLEIPSRPADVASLAARRRGFLVTSYTAVKRARAGLVAPEAPSVLAGPEEAALERAPSPEALPGGAATGIFLHEILAKVGLDDLASVPPYAAWRARPEVGELLERQRRRHGRVERELEPAARLVHAAYTTPIHLGDHVLGTLAAARPALREMEFLYPMPEPGQPLLSRAGGDHGGHGWRIERGVVKGFIDLLFEHEGRVFVCDWKSDLLPSYTPAVLDEHCQQHYDVQARLYTLAALRMGGITDPSAYARRFGGVLFCFVRGLAPGGEGVLHVAPRWEDVVAWETDMLGPAFWGLAR